MTSVALPESAGPASASGTWSHPAQHVVRCLHIKGGFETQVARTAFTALLERHPLLRTALPDGATVPAVTVPDPARVDFATSEVPAAQALARAATVAAEPFDLARGPLLRLRVLELGDGERLLVAAAHRLVLDPGTLDAFLAEHARMYTAVLRGGPAAGRGPAEPADAVWPPAEESAAIRDRRLREAAGMPVLDLPTDHPRPSRPERAAAVVRCTVPQPLARRLRALATAPEDPSVLYAAAAVLLARHTGQGAVPLLVPVAPEQDRPGAVLRRPETDVVLTLQPAENPTFHQLAEHIREELDRARADAGALPPGALAEAVGTCGDPGRQPVPVKVAARAPAGPPPHYPGASCTSVDVGTGTAARDLSLRFDLHDETLSATLEYDTGLFEPVTARRLTRRLEHLLAAVADDPHRPVAELPVLPPEERALVVTDWNRTARDFPRTRTTSSLFEEQVARAPDAIAVQHEDERLTYRELNVRANRLAHRLIDAGVRPDQPVGLCLPRSVDMMVSLLAILKAGGAYLPLDPGHPVQRLAFVVRDAGARVVVTDAAHADAFADTPATALRPDQPDPHVPGDEPADPQVAATAEHLAYVIYTSGSTGRPKGVAVPHRALSRLVKGADYARLGSGEAHLHLSPLTFDASLLEVWGPLLNGGTVVLPPSGLPFPDQLKAALRKHRITTLLLISPQLQVGAEQFPEDLARVRQLLVGGDVLSPAAAARLLPHLHDTRFLHVYGPTECTLFATWQPIEAADTLRPTIPIGRPLANTQAYVLDERLNPAPVGVPGELWLGGDGLARGYLGRPDLDAERFVASPFGPPGSRMYRSGDLARWLPDGRLEFLGRGDDQVKIRGYRIELGEIEAALADHPLIRSVAVVVRDDAPGGRELAAYLVGDDLPEDAALREHLSSRLPSYMVPAAFVRLDELPLTENGKLDRKNLPAPRSGGAPPPATAPADTLEGQVLATMAEVLQTEGIGPDDDFFEYGGNSLLLVDLFTLLQERFPDAGLELADLLDNRTGAHIAVLLDAAQGRA
ncbi:amino acid adenylation domain-containing protein [Streptomyces sp. NPDC012474]|uniref:non-ribosomal peptide synthetase n=1 Tax=Streptomyces sp. NPDC012474 TaxID=3364836 RepID=UPI0036E9C966